MHLINLTNPLGRGGLSLKHLFALKYRNLIFLCLFSMVMGLLFNLALNSKFLKSNKKFKWRQEKSDQQIVGERQLNWDHLIKLNVSKLNKTVVNFNLNVSKLNKTVVNFNVPIKKEGIDETTKDLLNEKNDVIPIKGVKTFNVTRGSSLVQKYLKLFNLFGSKQVPASNPITFFMDKLDIILAGEDSQFRNNLKQKLHQKHEALTPTRENFTLVNAYKRRKSGVEIIVGTIACGNVSKIQALTMIKSAMIGSQEAHLHVILFSDKDTLLSMGEELLTYKWTAHKLNWDFSFELHLTWFPNDTTVNWSTMWRPCATQRLFFPSLLPKVDSLIFLDADTIIVSNLTEMWTKYMVQMEGKLVAASSNTVYPAKGYYNVNSQIPFYSHGGLNAGIMLMNLTGMREFDLESRSLSVYNVYRDLIFLADQDIYNVIFHTFKEKVLELSCTYNVNWVQCGSPHHQICPRHTKPGPICFCHDSMRTGVHIVHGNLRTFFNEGWPFLPIMHKRYSQIKLLENSIVSMIQELKTHFRALKFPPCFNLTADALYGNIERYAHTIYNQQPSHSQVHIPLYDIQKN